MKRVLFLILFILTLQSAFSGDSKTYFRADYGMGKFKTNKLDALNANPIGSTYGFGFGGRMGNVELGIFYKTGTYQADINHDGLANKIDHKTKSYGLDLNIFLNRHFSLKVGYAINSYAQKVAIPLDVAAMMAIKSAYGLEEDKSSTNFFYGANVDIFGGKTYDIYASVLQFPAGDGKSTLTGQIGIRIYMNSSFGDFFSR